MVKGAESAILNRCVRGDVEGTAEHVLQYALVTAVILNLSGKGSEWYIYVLCGQEHNLGSISVFLLFQLGLRTLCVAQKQIPREEFDKFHLLLKEAQNSLDNRDEKVRETWVSSFAYDCEQIEHAGEEKFLRF